MASNQLLGNVLERPSVDDDDSDDENSVGYFSLPKGGAKHQLSPFGRVYYILDHLISSKTLQFLHSDNPQSKTEDFWTTEIEERPEWIKYELLRSHSRLVAVLDDKTQFDAQIRFLEDVWMTFNMPRFEIDVSEYDWLMVVLVFLFHGTSSFSFDISSLETHVLKPYSLSKTTFDALASVFDQNRYNSG